MRKLYIDENLENVFSMAQKHRETVIGPHQA